jgi:hypothetical protein
MRLGNTYVNWMRHKGRTTQRDGVPFDVRLPYISFTLTTALQLLYFLNGTYKQAAGYVCARTVYMCGRCMQPKVNCG